MPDGCKALQLFKRNGEGVYFAVDLLLPYPSGDELSGLRPEVEDDYFFTVNIHGFTDAFG